MFRLEGEYWAIRYGGEYCCLRDSVGLRHLARLLRSPGERIPAMQLEAAARSLPLLHFDVPYGGRSREQARVNVTRAIRAARRRIAGHLPALGDHLSRTVRTGASCAYDPDPRVPMRWDVDDRAGMT